MEYHLIKDNYLNALQNEINRKAMLGWRLVNITYCKDGDSKLFIAAMERGNE